MSKTKAKASLIRTLLLFCSILYSINTFGQDFMMQGWYWDYPKTCNGANWANTLNGKASDMGSAGFTYVWLPPTSRASFGSCSNGYDPQDLYDLGNMVKALPALAAVLTSIPS